MHEPLDNQNALAVSCPYLCRGPSQAVLVVGNYQRLAVALGIFTGQTSEYKCDLAGEEQILK